MVHFPWHRPRGPYALGVERGTNGYAGVWCFDLPGCYGLVRPGEDPVPRALLAILEFNAWSHNRAAAQHQLHAGQVVVAQWVDAGIPIGDGDSVAFFQHDAEAPSAGEFPLWANPHDAALDQLSELMGSIPAGILAAPIAPGGRTLRDVVDHVREEELRLATVLRPGPQVVLGEFHRDQLLKQLRGAHVLLQEAVCDVDSSTRVRATATDDSPPEEWSVRKVMRRSIWHIRYHTAEINRALGELWLTSTRHGGC